MVFNTHNRTPRKNNTWIRIVLFIVYGLLIAFIAFVAIACSISIQSISLTLVILIPFLILALGVIISAVDINKAFVKVDGDTIIVVDYYFGVKKEKNFTRSEIKQTDISRGSFYPRGYWLTGFGLSYIVFKDENSKYLFKIINLPEIKEFFSEYLENEIGRHK